MVGLAAMQLCSLHRQGLALFSDVRRQCFSNHHQISEHHHERN